MSDQLPESVGYRIIGHVDDFTSFPASVTIDRDPYFIIQTTGQEDAPSEYKLVSAICPHAGGVVRPWENELICPLHYWSFDSTTGQSTNVPGEQLDCRPIQIHEGQFTIAVSS
ncbi:Rieske (2Fe-2S) protein [Paenibacillus sepulcri]|uniref:Rieske (2Fe-2S) protein n=1 Tax=Paenibacillus sepulcri TaxID=359917 RepID=A0ABS7CJM4_9BACL|nr:Rieske (2Fe-2S) protein [Paenibacillus sepulcri]